MERIGNPSEDTFCPVIMRSPHRTSADAAFLPEDLRSRRSWSFVWWILVPLWCLFWLWNYPPHGFDLAFEKQFFVNGGWPWHAEGAIEFWLHFMPKVVSITLFLIVLGSIFYWKQCRQAALRARDAEDAANCSLWSSRLIYAFAAAAVCVLTLWWLKQITGVACPWHAEPFGGKLPIQDPGFALWPRDGSCWPSGAAGSGFCLLPLYFALRDLRPWLSRAALALALVLGFGAGIGRVMTGAHFISHVPAALALDWIISALIYVLAFDREGLRTKFRALIAALPFMKGKCSIRPEDRLCYPSLVVLTSLWWAVIFSGPMLSRLMMPDNAVTTDSVLLGVSAAGAFAFISAALIELLALFPRPVFRGLLFAFNLLGAVAFAAAYLYGTAMTPDMVRNFLATDTSEALAYVSRRSVMLFLAVWLPIAWAGLAACGPKPSEAAGFFKALFGFFKRFAASLGLAAAGVAMIGLNFQTFAGAMRSDTSLRYMIAPVNVVYSGVRTMTGDSAPGSRPRIHVDPAPALSKRPSRPSVLVVAVGETARSASWQLAGYERETTPELAKLPIISIPRVQACGTSTDVSLPCMMSRIGRSDYDRDRILSEEQLPSLLQRAGAKVVWIDNQSGCKGACTDVPARSAAPAGAECPNGECGDLVLLAELKEELGKLPADRPTVIFLHMMGSHGPAYFRRSQLERKIFQPECEDADLKSCSRESVLNAYDNSIRETDHVLAEMIRMLDAASGKADAGLIYLSDHGESLGESGLYLHGAPYWIAPDEQKEVPMVIWMGAGFAKARDLSRDKIRARAASGVTQESLYHTVVGMLGVKTTTYVPGYDLSR